MGTRAVADMAGSEPAPQAAHAMLALHCPATHLLRASSTSVGARLSSSSTIQCPRRTACTSSPSRNTSRPLSSLT